MGRRKGRLSIELTSDGEGEESKESAMLEPSRTRVNGFQRPFARDQVVAWIAHAITALMFSFLLLCFIISSNTTLSQYQVFFIFFMAGLYIFVVVGLLIPWVSCETIDPALEQASSYCGKTLKGKRWEVERYCATCRKAVPGLDHHCNWLNTCIGKQNYTQFAHIIAFGFLQFAIQTIVSLTFIYWWVCEDTEEPDTLMQQTFKVVTVLCVLVSIPATLMYTAVISFHLYLNHVNLGTYEWMLERRKRAREQRQANRTVELASHLSETQTASV